MTSILEGILVQVFETQSKYKNKKTIYTFPSSASHTFPCLGLNQPISALSSNSSTNTDCAHVVLSRFIVLPTYYLYFSEPTHLSQMVTYLFVIEELGGFNKSRA